MVAVVRAVLPQHLLAARTFTSTTWDPGRVQSENFNYEATCQAPVYLTCADLHWGMIKSSECSGVCFCCKHFKPILSNFDIYMILLTVVRILCTRSRELVANFEALN